MKKPLLIIGLLFAAAVFVSRSPVLAEVSTTNTFERTVTNTDSQTRNLGTSDNGAIGDLRQKTTTSQESVTDRCQLVTQKIDTALSKYQSNRTTQIDLYKSMADKIQQILLKLQQRGIDVTTLQTDLQQFNVKIQQLNTDASAAAAQLQVAKQFECGNSEGQFKTELEKARTLMQAAEKDAKDIRSFFTSTIRPDIEALRKQISNTESAKRTTASPRPATNGSDATVRQ